MALLLCGAGWGFLVALGFGSWLFGRLFGLRFIVVACKVRIDFWLFRCFLARYFCFVVSARLGGRLDACLNAC
ncbi:hypothetical protein BKN38_06700 [Helicobacter sp. CLO-3]|nr:hypothetical protein BA723_09045 [Helicobacter sp. CLO-3]OHU82599.1 hypothetical protein BKN38_06700 [Helicobacter sp. CLO-3]